MCPFAGYLIIHSGNGDQLSAPCPIYYYRERPVGRIGCNFHKWTMWASAKWLNHPRYTGQGHSRTARVGPTQLSCTHKPSPISSSSAPLHSPSHSSSFPEHASPTLQGHGVTPSRVMGVTPSAWLLAIGAFVPQIGFKFTHLKS